VDLHNRYRRILGSDSTLLAGRNEDIEAIAKKWASVLSNAEARADAEATARILLAHNIALPELMERDLGKYKKGVGITCGRYKAPMYEGDSHKVIVNINAEKKWAYYKAMGATGHNAQDNVLLHEAGHYIDNLLEPDVFKTIEHEWKMTGINRDLIKRELSEYALYARNEFEAELISSTLRGKTFSKELLSYSNLNNIDKKEAKDLLNLASGKELCTPVEDLRRKFEDMMRVVYNTKGANFSIDILADPKVADFIDRHSETLNRSLTQIPMSDAMRRRLERSNWVFSGMKTFHELNEAFPSLIDKDGNRKPFEQFFNDVQKIDSTYNKDYLRAEYNFIQSSAEMAAKWEQFSEDGDRYYLQYRTAGDDKVRPEHAALNRVTLPMDDKFWEEYFPPNGWNCRCTVVQVRKSKQPPTPHDEAMALGEEATGKDTKGMFHFNPGKEERSVPKYNPYTLGKCKTCTSNKSKLAFAPSNEVCAACAIVNECYGNKEKSERTIERKHYSHIMEPLIKEKVVKETEFGPIKIGFTKDANGHLYSDAISRSRIFTLDDLKDIKSILENATYSDYAEAKKGHEKNHFERFFYFDTELRGSKIRINVGQRTQRKGSGMISRHFTCYSITDIKK